VTKLIYALAELCRDAKELIVWMKSREYPTCGNCRYWCEDDGSGAPACIFNGTKCLAC
jgi:hypothetical protein